MKRLKNSIFVSLIVIISCCASGQGTPLALESVVIQDVTVIDGTGKPAHPHMTVRVRDGRIESIEKFVRGEKVEKGALRVNGSGKFLIPGLWDTHLHLVDIGEEAIPILPYYGITSVRDMGGDIPKLKEWRSQIERGELIGPRVKLCGPMLEGKWDPTSVGGRTDHWVVADPEQARATVAKLAGEGVDCIKMRSYASPETYLALAAAAKNAGLPLVGHAPFSMDPIAASNAGQRTLEHAFFPWPWAELSSQRRSEIESTFRKNSTLVVPTLIAWETDRLTSAEFAAYVNDIEAKSDPRLRYVSASLRKNWRFSIDDLKAMNTGSPGWQKVLDQHYEMIAEMHRNGVGMMAGTDTGAPLVFPGSALHDELKLLVTKANFTPMDALLTATIIPAKMFHMEDQLGTIEKGKLADLVLLTNDPLEDIANTRKIEAVMLAGKWLDRQALAQISATVLNKIERMRKSGN